MISADVERGPKLPGSGSQGSLLDQGWASSVLFCKSLHCPLQTRSWPMLRLSGVSRSARSSSGPCLAVLMPRVSNNITDIGILCAGEKPVCLSDCLMYLGKRARGGRGLSLWCSLPDTTAFFLGTWALGSSSSKAKGKGREQIRIYVCSLRS